MSAGDEALVSELSTTPYEYVRPLARGGMSSVHLVRHRALGHELVMKLLGITKDPDQREEMTRRLLREGRVLRSLQDPRILRVVDFGFTRSMRAYLITELLAGKTLKEEVKANGPLPTSDVIEIARQVLGGLDHAHAVGLVHRDLKPENIMWLDSDAGRERRVKILDFGIVKILDVGVQMKVGGIVPTVPGQILGTPAYASPEQIAGMPADARADLYGVGGVLFFLLTGRGPFVGKDTFTLLQAHIMDKPAPPSHLRPDVPAWLDAVVLKALAKDRRDRFGSAREMLEVIERGAAISAPAGATTIKLEDVETQPLPPQTLRDLAMETASPGLARSPEPPNAAMAPAPPRPLPTHPPRGPTVYQSSPLQQALASAAERPPLAAADGQRLPAVGRPRAKTLSSAAPPIEPERPGSRRSRGRDMRALYWGKVVLWGILVALALIGLLRVAGLDP